MSIDPRPAMPSLPARRRPFRPRRDWLFAKLATCLTVACAAVAVLIAAAAAVAFTFS